MVWPWVFRICSSCFLVSSPPPALTVRFLTGRFLHRYDPTLEDEYCTQAEVDGETFQLRILDTAGQVREGAFMMFHIRHISACGLLACGPIIAVQS